MKFKNKLRGLLFYIITPVLFSLLGYTVIYALFSPIISSATMLFGVLKVEVSPDVSDDRSIYDGTSAGVAVTNGDDAGQNRRTEENAETGENSDTGGKAETAVSGSETLPKTADTTAAVGSAVKTATAAVTTAKKAQPVTVKVGSFIFPAYGVKFGNIKVEGTGVNAPLYMGDSESEMDKGVGVFYGGKIPGDNGTVLIAGHSSSWFGGLEDAEAGVKVYIDTNYGSYVYEITDIHVYNADDASAYDLSADHENVVLYTCYPFGSGSLLSITQRCFFYCKYISGPMIDRS